MNDIRTPIGGTHARDFAPLRQQRPLSELRADTAGFVRFACLKCPRQDRVALAELRGRFHADAGLVDVLNALAPKDCALAQKDPWGNHLCGFCYRDLAEQG